MKLRSGFIVEAHGGNKGGRFRSREQKSQQRTGEQDQSPEPEPPFFGSFRGFRSRGPGKIGFQNIPKGFQIFRRGTGRAQFPF